jgi:VanZ family protein
VSRPPGPGPATPGAGGAPVEAPVGPVPWTRRLLHWLPAAVWAALIFGVSSLSALPEAPTGITDKHAHLGVYGVLGALLVWGLTAAAPRRTTWRTVVLAVVLATIYGVSDEWHQSFVPNRQVSGLDVAADAAGAALAAVGLRAWAIIRARR